MFHIEPHDQGFQITWLAAEREQASELVSEMLLEGLQRHSEWSDGIVVERYRNEFETLEQIAELCTRLGITLEFDDDLAAFRNRAGDETQKYQELIAGETTAPAIDAVLVEFPSRQLLPYQCEAVARHHRNRHSADFSVPGAGKTSVALAYWALCCRQDPDLGLWVVGPLSCFRPWEEEFAECFGRLPNSQRIRGNHAQRVAAIRRAIDCELVLCNYQTAWREEAAIVGALRRRRWLLLLDEAHYAKSMDGVISGAVRNLAPHADRRLILTGTPMPRSPADVWSLFTFLWPAVLPLGNAQQFELRCRESPAIQVCEELRTAVAPLFHRTRKHDLGLPPIEFTDHAINPEQVPASQRLIVRLIESRTLEESQHLVPRDRAHLRRWRRARVIRLLQAASNPELLADALDWSDIAEYELDGEEQVADFETIDVQDARSDLAQALRRYCERQTIPAKAKFVANRARDLAVNGEKVVIWAHFQKNIRLLAELLEDLRPLCVMGAVPAYDADEDEDTEETREQRIAVFKSDPERRILIASAAACAESISLHRVCQHAIYFERSFNAAHFLQSVDRIHRQGMLPGKTAHVEIPYIPCAIERVVNRRLQRRQVQLYQLLDDPMPVIGFDDAAQTGFFELEEFDDIDSLFDEVLAEIRADTE